MSGPPERTIRKFNPGVFQSDQEIIDQFVVRGRELKAVLEVIHNNIGAPSCQHTLVVGPRGRGKTMLLARVAAEIRTDPQLRQALVPVRFMEESMEVFDIEDFWLDALLYLAKECAESHPDLCSEIQATHESLARRTQGDDIAGQAKAALLDAADGLGRRLVLMVENLQSLCEDVDEDFGWQLRQSLQSDPEIILLGTATSRFKALDDASAPFFELFRIFLLEPLSTVECQRLWHMITDDQRDAREMRPLEIFTGGSPRLLVIVAEFARHRTMAKLLEELVDLVDDHSEYFRANLNSLPKTERRVFVALADLWRPSTTREVAIRARLGVRKTSALLGRLVGRGAVNIDGDGRNRLYSVGEPLHCIYYKLRRWRDEAAVVHGLIRFMVAFYGPDETAEILGSLLADETHHTVFLSAQEHLDPDFTEIPAGGAAATYRELVERHRDFGDTERRIRVASELLDIGARLGESGESEHSIEYNEELIRRFDSTPIPEVQTSVAKALFNKALVPQSAREHEAAVTAFNEVVTRFEKSEVPDIQQCVGGALVNRGFHLGRLGELEPATASYDAVIERFGDSPLPRLRLCVAMSLKNKGSTLARLDSSESLAMAVATWEDVIERFSGDSQLDIQIQVASALTKKAGAEMRMGRNRAAVAACDEAVRRYGANDRLDLRREVAMALELKAMILNRVGRGREALETCDVLVRDFGAIAGEGNIPVAWRAMGSQIHARVLEGMESAAAQAFQKMCDNLDVADNGMVTKIVWDTIDLMAAGATPGVFADALEASAEDCEELVPLLAALRKLAGRPERVPDEFGKVVGDIVLKIEERRASGLQPANEGSRFQPTYSFKKAPFVHPKIVSDLVGSLADSGDQVVAINLLASQNSNRYFGDILVTPQRDPLIPSWPWVYTVDEDPSGDEEDGMPQHNWERERCAYRYVGTTQNGLDVLHQQYSGGGSGVFNTLMFVRIEADYGVEYPLLRYIDSPRAVRPAFRPRELIRMVGTVPLGDRWQGTIEIVGDEVVVRGRDWEEMREVGIDCKEGEPSDPPPARVYKAPVQGQMPLG